MVKGSSTETRQLSSQKGYKGKKGSKRNNTPRHKKEGFEDVTVWGGGAQNGRRFGPKNEDMTNWPLMSAQPEKEKKGDLPGEKVRQQNRRGYRELSGETNDILPYWR